MRHASYVFTALALSLGACTEAPTAPVGAPGSAHYAPSPAADLSPGPSPSGGASAKPSPKPSPTPSPLKLRVDFESAALGSQPTDFVDVATEEAVPAWVYQGNWRISKEEDGNQVFLHDDVRQQPAVSFQRYRGDGLGQANGVMPPVYYAEVAMRPIRSPNNYAPTGDQGVQFFYLAYNRYVEVVVKPDYIEIWECNGGEPKLTKGWKRIWGQTMKTAAGDLRRIGALVDMPAGTFTAYLDGKPLYTATSSLITPQPAWITLRGIGNVVSFDNLVVETR